MGKAQYHEWTIETFNECLKWWIPRLEFIGKGKNAFCFQAVWDDKPEAVRWMTKHQRPGERMRVVPVELRVIAPTPKRAKKARRKK